MIGTVTTGMALAENVPGLNSVTGGISGVFNGIVSNGIGSVLANGLDLSCWGSSMTPAKAKDETPKDVQDIMTKSGLGSSVTSTTVNKFVEIMEFYIMAKTWSANNTGNSSCTRKGNKAQADMARAVLNETLKSIEQSFDLTPVGTQTKQSGYTFKFTWNGANYGQNAPFTHTLYSVKSKSNTNTINENGTESPDTNLTAKSGNSMAGFGAVGLGLLALLFLGGKK